MGKFSQRGSLGSDAQRAVPRLFAATIVAVGLVGCSSSSEPPDMEELSPAGLASMTPSQPREADSAWYNQRYLKYFFGDFARSEQVYVTSPESIRELTGRGEYLVKHVAACGVCHGTKPGEPSAPLSGGRPMRDSYGSVNAANITPSRDTGIGGWNIFDLMRAIRASIDREGRPLSNDLHASYRWMSDQDAKAISLYLLSQAPIEKAVERRRLGGFERNTWGLIPQHHEVAGYVPAPVENESYQYGQYVAQNVSGCVNCHTQGGLRGGERLFSGAKRSFGIGTVVRDFVALLTPFESTPVDEETSRALLSQEAQAEMNVHPVEEFGEKLDIPKLYSDALDEGRFPITGPDIRGKMESGIKNWSEDDIVRYLTNGKSPEGEERERRFCPWPFYSGMKVEAKRAIAKYLKTLG